LVKPDKDYHSLVSRGAGITPDNYGAFEGRFLCSKQCSVRVEKHENLLKGANEVVQQGQFLTVRWRCQMVLVNQAHCARHLTAKCVAGTMALSSKERHMDYHYLIALPVILLGGGFVLLVSYHQTAVLAAVGAFLASVSVIWQWYGKLVLAMSVATAVAAFILLVGIMAANMLVKLNININLKE
jgi:hypothetical protein